MKPSPPLWLLIGLMIFPQLVETLYSPALPAIAARYAVSEAQAAQTLSIYFSAFTIGVALWGWLSDRIGRRPAMLLGLACYGSGAALALIAPDFHWLLLARALAAFGAAAGSVVTQTILRDSCDASRLAHVFALMGMALAISPALGLLSGGALLLSAGLDGVFMALAGLALLLLGLAWRWLPETRPASRQATPLGPLAARMLRDSRLWRDAALVALFNTMLFSYYSLAPFVFDAIGLSSQGYGLSGIALAAAALAGAWANRRLLAKGRQPAALIRQACALALLGSLGVWVCGGSAWLLLPMAGIVIAYGIAIPNVLSLALQRYREALGSAGALFGLSYYLLLALGLALSGLSQNLACSLLFCSALTLPLCTAPAPKPLKTEAI
ncbi:MFS transporter [Chromobacterium sp. IIBBL 290-4]|uniref:MFS transporter n=1 Tax=Chromobacterium sp. IIBBL 290-4 TaxID=2953890 RepID=UPI0020B7554B|nr:MFS transporter [Chromobacterium sp. IIBBL 290-4]UTH74559.1 MFS transporter [Chromobacterium sp. IIBBL 290-4]